MRLFSSVVVPLALTGLLGLSACEQETSSTAEVDAVVVEEMDAAQVDPQVAAQVDPQVAAQVDAVDSLDPGYLAATDGLAPLLEGIGPVDFPISTDVPRAQAYFNQALTFSYGFNHAEAARSFTEAARLDENCGICWWGVALVLGPNINAEMAESSIAPAWEALNKAIALRDDATELEQALIDALSTRYSEVGDDREALDAVYAGSMQAVADMYPENVHVLALYAESLMNLYPWDYWDDDGAPREHTVALVELLEQIMEMDGQHPGGLHLYIHVMERFTPEKAVAAADALGPLVPVAGHLVHMPSHIYLRVGRYHDAVLANEKAALADEDYIGQCNAQGFYPAAYYPHNIHFLWYSAMMEGRKELALSSAQRLYDKVPLDMAREYGAIQRYLGVRGATYIRFGMWEEAIAEPDVPEGMPMASFTQNYSRGVAKAASGDLAGARESLASLRAAQGEELAAVMDRQGDIADLLSEIAINLVEAEIARAEQEDALEIEFLTAAVAAQDALPYTEPPFWHFPVRQSLGSAYLRQGDAQAAAMIFTEDLERFPNNGWSLYGLREALAVLGEPTQDLDAALEVAWEYSDIAPTSGP